MEVVTLVQVTQHINMWLVNKKQYIEIAKIIVTTHQIKYLQFLLSTYDWQNSYWHKYKNIQFEFTLIPFQVQYKVKDHIDRSGQIWIWRLLVPTYPSKENYRNLTYYCW